METTILLDITPADILNANIVIISGILILLTISIFSSRKKPNDPNIKEVSKYVAYSPLAFVFSTGLLLIMQGTGLNFMALYAVVLGSFIGGLVYLTAAVVHIVKVSIG